MNQHIGMDAQDTLTHHFHLALSDIACARHQLTIEIGHIDGIEINEGHFFDATANQAFDGKRSDPTTAENCDVRLFNFFEFLRTDEIFDADIRIALHYGPTFYKISTLEDER